MNFDNLTPQFSLLYLKAREHLDVSVQNKDNSFLREELSIPWEKVRVIDHEIKIVFSKSDFTRFILEVSLLLLDGNQPIGRYQYFQNEHEDGIDDRLVFY